MNANELRLGNYVMQHDYSKGNRQVLLESISYWEVNNLDEKYLEPIPLTKEWLLKFGFKKIGKCYEFWENSIFNIEFIRNHWHVCCIEDVICTHIKHVHQLQNLYFALTGSELEIKE